MVLSNTKLKRKKREEAAAVATLAPPADSSATLSSEDVVKGDVPLTLSDKKKRLKAKKVKVNEKVSRVDVPVNEENGIFSTKSDVTLEGSAFQEKGAKEVKKRKAADVVLAQEAPMKIDDSRDKASLSAGGNIISGEEKGEDGVAVEGNSGKAQGDGALKTKIRKKPRWEVDESGKRIKPAKAGVEGESLSQDVKAMTPAVKDTTTGDGLTESHAENDPNTSRNGDRILQGNEPWLESKRSKKKKKLTDRWGKKLDEAAVSDQQAVDHDEPQDISNTEVKVDPKKVMVGGMPYYISEDDIHEFFQECGTIAELDCMTFPDTGKFKGIAFITFRTEEAAKRSLALDGADMGGRFLKIEICKLKPRELIKKDAYKEPPKKHEGCLSAYIGNLSWDITEKELRKFFKGCKIDSIRFAVNKDTGEFRGFGHVDFADDESLEAAMKLDQMPVLDRALKIAYSVPQKNKSVDHNPGQSGGRKKGCFTCGEEGHMSYNCPKKQ